MSPRSHAGREAQGLRKHRGPAAHNPVHQFRHIKLRHVAEDNSWNVEEVEEEKEEEGTPEPGNCMTIQAGVHHFQQTPRHNTVSDTQPGTVSMHPPCGLKPATKSLALPTPNLKLSLLATVWFYAKVHLRGPGQTVRA